MASAEEVDVEVGDGFASVGAVVDDQSEALIEIELTRDIVCGEEEMAEDRLVLWLRFADSGDESLGDDQHMHRCLRLHVVKSDAVLILMGDFGGNFSIDDFLKNGLGHI